MVVSYQEQLKKRDELEAIIASERIEVVFQPIFDIGNNRLLGYEALARGPRNSRFEFPLSLFSSADQYGLRTELEELSIRKAASGFVDKRLPGKLFLNVSPDIMLRLNTIGSAIYRLLILDPDCPRLVLELSEKYPLHDMKQIRLLSELIHEHGHEIAIDDLGTGYSGLLAWSEVRPDYVKIDRHFVNGIHTDSVKREFVRSIHEISRGLFCKVIAEGIEDARELEVLRGIGIKFGQGFLLQPPGAEPETGVPEILTRAERTLSPRFIHTSPAETISELLTYVAPLPPDTRSETVMDIFKANQWLRSIPIVDGSSVPIGLISRNNLQALFSGRFAHQLFGRDPVSAHMNRSPVVVDHQMRLEEVSRLITRNNDANLNDDFILTRESRYLGVGQTSELLRRITEYNIRYARYSNPLTLLPGNVPIHEWIDELLAAGSDFRLAYIDLNNFKPFNDTYGYSRGDEVITALADILLQCAVPDVDMVGHVGGDDFVAIFRGGDWEARCARIIELFEQGKTRFYPREALDQGGIYCEDRQGNPVFHELLTVAVGVVNPDPSRCHSHHDVAALASAAKHQAKLRKSSYLFISRRRTPD
jgi:diguanylate cyclase (GGDEF)-like protein